MFHVLQLGGGAKGTTTAHDYRPSRYDPDEAEARVRNLIADTERMLAGLSGLTGSNAHKVPEGVSV